MVDSADWPSWWSSGTHFEGSAGDLRMSISTLTAADALAAMVTDA